MAGRSGPARWTWRARRDKRREPVEPDSCRRATASPRPTRGPIVARQQRGRGAQRCIVAGDRRTTAGQRLRRFGQRDVPLAQVRRRDLRPMCELHRLLVGDRSEDQHAERERRRGGDQADSRAQAVASQAELAAALFSFDLLAHFVPLGPQGPVCIIEPLDALMRSTEKGAPPGRAAPHLSPGSMPTAKRRTR